MGLLHVGQHVGTDRLTFNGTCDVRVHRSESVLCAAMFLRIYLVWRWFIFHSFLQYSNMEASYVVKDWKTLKLLQKAASKSSARALLAIKFAMKLHPKQILVSLYWILILCVTYIVRLGDGPARREHRHVWRGFLSLPVCLGNG